MKYKNSRPKIASKKHKIKINAIKLIKKDSTPNNAIHPQLAEVVVFLHFKDKLISGFVISVIIVFVGTCFFGFLDLNSSAHLYWSLPMTFTMDNSLYMSFFYENKFFALTASIFLFLIFLKRKEFSNKYINYIAGSALGVYLIHGNIVVGGFTWPPFNFSSFYHSLI